MRLPRWAGLLALAAPVFWLGRGSNDLSAQALLPDGVFVRDSGGTIWLIIGGQRAQAPIFPADDSAIASVADTGLWVVPGEGGSVTLGGMPEYIFQPPVLAPPPAPPEEATPTPEPTATPAPENPAPTVSIQVDDERITAGQTVSVTVIAQDNGPIDAIQWEGTVEEDDDNDNQATGDPDLDAEHRHTCDGQSQCAFVWQVTPTTPGRYVLRARSRDEDGMRSEWVRIGFRVQAGAATATPGPVAPAGSPTSSSAGVAAGIAQRPPGVR